MKLSGNKILYTNIVANIDRRHDVIEYQLQKYYNFRVKEMTHEEVEAMQKQVDAIVEAQMPLAATADFPSKPNAVTSSLGNAEAQPETDDSHHPKQHRGKRDYHDLLPDEIKALYVKTFHCSNRCANFT